MPKNRIPDDSLCTICHKPRAAHDGDVVHAFRGEGEPRNLVARSSQSPDASRDGAQGSQGMPARQSSDALLRFVLIEKGLVTVADLDEAEAKLRATGVLAHDPAQITVSESEVRPGDAGDR